MENTKYKQSVENLSTAIDIALDVIQKYPPNKFKESDIKQFISVYYECKNKIENPAPRFANLRSLKYSIDEVFIYFQEGNGKAVNLFWERIRESQLPYRRENKLAKILKRKKIKNDIEYDFVVDVIVPYQQEGLIDESDIILLNGLISDFEKKQKKI
jgi:hypothetical protein